MIYTYIPYSTKEHDKDIGWAYNNFMEKLDNDDWVIFLDHDAMFTTIDWFHQIADIINKNPDAGEFSCVTNRIGNEFQKLKDIDDQNHDIKYHRLIGKQLQEKSRNNLVEFKHPTAGLSGVVIVTSKKAWKLAGGFKSGFLSVDWDYTQRLNKLNLKTYIMTGVYVYHWYRGDGNLSHIKE